MIHHCLGSIPSFLQGGLTSCQSRAKSLFSLVLTPAPAFSCSQHEIPGEIPIPWGQLSDGQRESHQVSLFRIFSVGVVTIAGEWQGWGLHIGFLAPGSICKTRVPLSRYHWSQLHGVTCESHFTSLDLESSPQSSVQWTSCS